MKIIRRSKVTASSVDKRLSFTSTKYKGYRISLDHKNNCYNIYDKHGELEDSGFMSQLAAKEAVDKLVKKDSVSSSQEINLPGYAVQYVTGYGGNGVNNIQVKYFRTPEERDKFAQELESRGAYGVEKYTRENFYHTLPSERSEVTSAEKIYIDTEGVFHPRRNYEMDEEYVYDVYRNLRHMHDPDVLSYDSFEDWLQSYIDEGWIKVIEASKKITSAETNDSAWKKEFNSELGREEYSLNTDLGSAFIYEFDNDGSWGYHATVDRKKGRNSSKSFHLKGSLEKAKAYCEDRLYDKSKGTKVNSSKKITSAVMYEDMDGSMTGEIGGKLSLEDLVDMYDDLKDYDPVVQESDSFESWLRDTIYNGYLRKVYSSKKIKASRSTPFVTWVKKAEDGSWVMWGGSNSPEKDPKFLDTINHPNYPNPEYNIENQYVDYVVLPAGEEPIDACNSINSAEEVEYLDNQDTLREFIDELVENGVDIYDDQDILQELGANYGYDREDQFAILEDIREYVGQGINSAEEVDEDELETADQEFTSRDTSINSSKLPAIYKLVDFPKGSVVLDFGGGKFDNAVDYLASIGCTGYVYDPYNRTSEHNAEVVKAIRSNGGADIVLNSNVLNVIKEAAARRTVLKNIKKLVKPSGKIYITVYEGNGSGEGKQSKKDSFQLNRKTADYLEEIQEVFPDATRKGKLIVATPNGSAVKSSINASEDTVTVGIYGDEVPGFEIVEQIVSYFRSKGIQVSDVSGDLEYGWEMNLTGDPRQLFFAVCNKIPGYNSDSVDEFVSEYQIDESINSCDSINASEDVQIDYDKLDEIAYRYCTSKPVSGDWNTETEHELRAIASELGLTLKQAKQVMIDELGFEESQFANISINASEDSLSSRIFDFLDDCGGYTDYNQKIEDVSEEFGMSPDEAEGYVASWAQGLDAMWHDTADQYEDQDIEESCKVEASYRTRHKNYCPHCTNRTLMEVEDGYYVCDECGAEYKGEPSFEGGLILEDVESCNKIEASLAPFQVNELVKEIQDELYNKASEVMQGPEFGFPLKEVADYLVIEVEYQEEENRIKCEVRAELGFDSLMELAEQLNPIVEKYSKWAYFDAVTSGIIESYIPLDEVYSSTSVEKKPITAAYSEPESLVRDYEIVFDTIVVVTEDSFEIEDTEEFNEIYDDEYNIKVEDDSDSIVEHIQDLVEMNMPDEPGKYRISGIAHMKYFIDNLYREFEGPSDPDDTLGSSWFNSEAADITYDDKGSYVEAFQVEKI